MEGEFRWESITPITLVPTESYVVAGHHPGDFDIVAAPDLVDVTFSLVTYEGGRSEDTTGDVSTSPIFPDESGPSLPPLSTEGRFGPNIDVIPEPATAALLGLGGLAMLGRRRS